MYYDFAVHPLVYVAAALAIFGLPMTLLFLAAMRAMAMGHSPKPAQPAPKSLAAQALIVPAKPVPVKLPKYTRKRALRIEWVSLPVERN